jgi:hypothetical protein
MLTIQKYVLRLGASFLAPINRVSTLNTKKKKFGSELLLTTPFDSKKILKNLHKSTFLLFSEILIVILVMLSNVHAEVRWYRYFDSRGIPTISSIVSEQHLHQGYDVLDSHMQLIRHYQPFSADKYAQQQVLREQAINRKISDRHLQETYISSDRATTQRDREISNIDTQIDRSSAESKHISKDLNENITTAANFDRQNKPIPASLKIQLDKNRALLNQSNVNIVALKIKREQLNKQFYDAITQLKVIEAQGNKPDTTTKP